MGEANDKNDQLNFTNKCTLYVEKILYDIIFGDIVDKYLYKMGLNGERNIDRDITQKFIFLN